MCNDIIDGISCALNEYFGEEYKIYAETVEQGLSSPCFFISHEDTQKKKMLGDRYIARYNFDIQYFPKESKAEMLDMAERLPECLDNIELSDGSSVRGKGMRYSIINGVLHFNVSFSVILAKMAEADIMDSISYSIL